jgi:hypothetical protein
MSGPRSSGGPTNGDVVTSKRLRKRFENDAHL